MHYYHNIQNASLRSNFAMYFWNKNPSGYLNQTQCAALVCCLVTESGGEPKTHVKHLKVDIGRQRDAPPNFGS